MDKRVIFAVAGSGKTSHIINSIEIDSRVLLITYTDNNLANLKSRVIKKFGKIPSGVKIYSYFTFLYKFCVKPILGLENKAKGINWDVPPAFTLRLARTNPKFYIDRHKRLYHNRIAKYLEFHGVIEEVIERLEKYFDLVCIDEVQDFGGHDFNLLCSLASARTDILMVGDYFQHTFDTSRDGNVNANLHKDYQKYKGKFEAAGLVVDEELLSNSFRCSPTVCQFVSNDVGIVIGSNRTDNTPIEFVECKDKANHIFNCNDTIKLFYQSSNRYPGVTNNWGATKGQDCYNDVCVVLNPTTLKRFREGALPELPQQTKNKLYVAITRTKGSLYFVPENLYKEFRV